MSRTMASGTGMDRKARQLNRVATASRTSMGVLQGFCARVCRRRRARESRTTRRASPNAASDARAVDKPHAVRLNAAMRRLAALALAIGLSGLSAPSAAVVGGAPAADPATARHVVLIVGSHGTFCTGVALARDLVLTAAHCALPGADYKLMEFDSARRPVLRDVAAVARHPQFDLKTLLGHRATADVALLRLAAPLGGGFVPAALAALAQAVAAGDPFMVAGYGVAVRGDGRSSGTL